MNRNTAAFLALTAGMGIGISKPYYFIPNGEPHIPIIGEYIKVGNGYCKVTTNMRAKQQTYRETNK